MDGTNKNNPKRYEWQDNEKQIDILFNISAIKPENVEVTDCMVKVSYLGAKPIILDLADTVDYSHPTLEIQSQCFHLLLNKIQHKKWDTLETTLPKEERRKRREDSINRKAIQTKQAEEQSNKQRTELEKKAFDDKLKIEDAQREYISMKKKEIKQQAEDNLFKELAKIEEPKKVSKDIFNDEAEENIVQITPTVERIFPNKKKETQFVKMGFTERTHPNVAARESMQKEPPYPRSKKYKEPSEYDKINFEERNPVWLKDKGDNFMNNHDYVSAMSAYSRAIEIDPEFTKCFLNRATCLLCMRGYGGCINDCETVERLCETLKKDDEEFYKKMRFRGRVKKAAALCWSNKLEESIDAFNKALELRAATPEEIKEIQADIKAIEERKAVEKDIIQIEAQINNANFDEVEKLIQALYSTSVTQGHSNEKVENVLSRYHEIKGSIDKCLDHCNWALEAIDSFNKDTKSFETNKILEIEVTMRKIKCLQNLNRLPEAKTSMEQAMLLDPKNNSIQEMLHETNSQINEALSKQLCVQANEMLANKKFEEAYAKYEECLRLTKKVPSMQNIRLLTNKVACLLFMKKYESAIIDCNTALVMIKNYRTLLITAKGLNVEESKALVELELRLHIRRSNSLLNLHRVKEALDEMLLAKEINPSDIVINDDVKKLKTMLLNSQEN